MKKLLIALLPVAFLLGTSISYAGTQLCVYNGQFKNMTLCSNACSDCLPHAGLKGGYINPAQYVDGTKFYICHIKEGDARKSLAYVAGPYSTNDSKTGLMSVFVYELAQNDPGVFYTQKEFNNCVGGVQP